MKFLVIILLGITLYGNTSDTYAYNNNFTSGRVLIDSTVFNYFPLNIGNRWVWYTERNFSPGPGYNSLILQSTQTINGHVYYKGRSDTYIIYGNQHYTSDVYYRIDSITGNLCNYILQDNIECLIDSLNSSVNDSSQTGCQPPYSWYRYTISTYNIFNQNYPAKMFSWSNYFEAAGFRKYVKGIGHVYSFGQAVMSQTIFTLRGCVINGILSGDTSILAGINQISAEIPDRVSLSQNYPNPFNPTTHFVFRIADFGFVRLTVYDVIGKEVQVLVNEELQPGSYEADWDASAYPSGVYYYKLESGNFSETKKMVLIK